MSKPKIAIVSGFPGAGKTDAILAMANRMEMQGPRVAVIVNKLLPDCLDAKRIAADQFPVVELSGAPLSDDFDTFLAALTALAEREQPDIIFVEAQGCACDLVSTLQKPLREYAGDRFDLAPLTTLVDARRLDKALNPGDLCYDVNVEYAIRKQLHEADLLVLSKADTLLDSEIEAYQNFLKTVFPKGDAIYISARTGKFLDAWQVALTGQPKWDYPPLKLNYQYFGEGIATLCHLRATAQLRPQKPLDGAEFLMTVAGAIREELWQADHEIFHLQLALQAGDDLARVHCVGLDVPFSPDQRMAARCGDCTLTLNLCAGAGGDYLQKLLTRKLEEAAGRIRADYQLTAMTAVAPPPPAPLHRLGPADDDEPLSYEF